jgi:hypothetical protein
MISTSDDFKDALWEPYETIKEFWVPDSDTVTIYVKFQDRAGNISDIYSDNRTQ